MLRVLKKERRVQEGVLWCVQIKAFQTGHGHIQVTTRYGRIVVRCTSQSSVCEQADLNGTAGLVSYILYELVQCDTSWAICCICGCQVDLELFLVFSRSSRLCVILALFFLISLCSRCCCGCRCLLASAAACQSCY